MKEWQKERLFFCYLREKRKAAYIFFSFLAVFVAVFFFYRLPMEAVLYSALLCSILALLYIFSGFFTYKKQYENICMLKKEPLLLEAGYPEAKGRLEEAYQDLLHMLCEERKQLVEENGHIRREMTDYYTMWVHQIKTPIAAMRLLLQTEGDGSQSWRPELSIQLFKIEEYVNMALQYLRLDCNSNDFVIRAYDLDQITRQAVRKYAAMFVRKKLALDYHKLDTEVLTDEKWLVFAIGQIISNAVKYTKEGSISIYMKPGEEKTLVISDTGIGIASEDLPRIFEKGFTGYNGRTDKKSTGIGLYLCKKTLDKLSHRIRVESQAGLGTSFYIDLASHRLVVE